MGYLPFGPTTKEAAMPRNGLLDYPPLRALTLALLCVVTWAGLTVSIPHASADSPVLAATTAGVEPGVVRIDTALGFQHAIGTGAGVVLTPDGIVLTNNHVIRGATDITATNVGNGQSYPVDVLGYDRKNDIAVLQLRGATDLPVAPTADSSSVRIGDPVTALGFPGGADLTRASGPVRALNRGIVANDDLTGSSEKLSDLIDFAADVQPGDSGGPLVNSADQVVGIVTAASQNYRMESTGGFAISLNRALSVANAIRSGNADGSVHVGPTGVLGVGIGNEHASVGVPVLAVLRGGPAEAAGVRIGDVITAVDASPITDGTSLTDVLDTHHAGDTVTLTYLDRARQSQSAPVTLVAGPPN